MITITNTITIASITITIITITIFTIAIITIAIISISPGPTTHTYAHNRWEPSSRFRWKI
jgi:hypothetical protein